MSDGKLYVGKRVVHKANELVKKYGVKRSTLLEDALFLYESNPRREERRLVSILLKTLEDALIEVREGAAKLEKADIRIENAQKNIESLKYRESQWRVRYVRFLTIKKRREKLLNLLSLNSLQ